MKTHRLVHALLGVALLTACTNASTSPASPSAADTPQTMIGRAAGKAIDQARKEMSTSNLTIGGDGAFHAGKAGIGAGSKVKAEITPQGDFLIEGKPVSVNAEQRALLLDYRRNVHAIADAGMTMGIKGADLAGAAIKEAIGSIFSGNANQLEQRMDAEAKKLEADAKQLCVQMPALLATQEKLAETLPAFKPYATFTQANVDDCNKKGPGSVFGNDGQEMQAEIRDGIRNGIRTAMQGAAVASGANSTATVDGVRFLVPAGTLSVETINGVSTLDAGGGIKVELEGDAMIVNGTRYPRPAKGSEVDLRDAAAVKIDGKPISAQ